MNKIEAVIKPFKLEEVKEALNKFNINGITVSQVMGCGLQKGRKEYFRGIEVTLNLLPKIMIEIVTDEHRLNDVLDIITKAARTGEVGDGKIFVQNIEDAIRIRTGERGESAL
jgi:nitrogen regulatory protein P-II 1